MMNRKLKYNRILLLCLTFMMVICGFWYHNFKFVEFIPLEGNVRELSGYGTWIERQDWWENASPADRNCLKQTLVSFGQDYKEQHNKFYIRAFIARDRNAVSNYTRQLIPPCYNEKGEIMVAEQRSGFFPEYLSYSMINIARALDALFMWN